MQQTALQEGHKAAVCLSMKGLKSSIMPDSSAASSLTLERDSGLSQKNCLSC
ncbi:MAG: hypothetical protein HZA17_05430 [Nitrospirae bacterium]|nr:hypothetical protein [Nitrospirota bacterium]